MKSLWSLLDVPVGKRVFVRHLTSRPDVCVRLREIGFCENAVVRCVARNNVCLICEVCNTRFGLNTAVAGNILVSRSEETVS